ncbi:Uncharacterised protein [Serratia plymuthica]|nr:Uncharacterised protein [Serratia plymuthica]
MSASRFVKAVTVTWLQDAGSILANDELPGGRWAGLKREPNTAIICRISSTETDIVSIPFSSG